MPAQHNTQWSGLLSDLQAQTHDLAARGLGMARDGTYPLPDSLNGTAQLFSSRRLVTAVPREMDRLYIQLAAPSVTFVWGPPGDDQALQAWAQLLTKGAVPTEGLRFAAWVRMAPSTHTSARAEFHCAYCSQPCKGWGDHMIRSCPVVLAAAMTGCRAMCSLLQARGYAVYWRDSLGATVYDKAGRATHWRLVRDEDVVVQSESTAWDVAVTWSGLLWAVAPQPWPARERAALTAGCLRIVADWVVLQPPARWSRLMRAGECEWPVGLSRPLADAGTLLRYAMGESACSVAGPRPELVGCAVPVSVLDPAERGACPDVVLRVGAPPSLQCRPRGGPAPSDQPGAIPGLHPPAAWRWALACVPGRRGATWRPRGPGSLLPRGGRAPAGPAGGERRSRAMGGRPRPGLGTRRRRGRRVPPQLITPPSSLSLQPPPPPPPGGPDPAPRGGPPD